MTQNLQAYPAPLAPFATYATQSRGRLLHEPPSKSRTEFQRDRDRIIHSGAFRKLRNKTQVFIEGEGDYYRTRLTHSLEVAQIAKSIARVLQLDEDLTEAVALAHDLGHTCFGHAGEDGLAEVMQPYGGFSHNEQTFRILISLETRYAAFDGLNLTWETLEGVVKHNGPVKHEMTPTLAAFTQKYDLELGSYAGPEAQVAALADDIAYNTHDIDDGHRAGMFRLEDLHDLPLFGPALNEARQRYPHATRDRLVCETVREVIGLMVSDVIATTRVNVAQYNPRSVEDVRHAPSALVAFSAEMHQNVQQLRHFLWQRLYRHTKINRVCAKAQRIVKELFVAFMDQPNCLPTGWAEAVQNSADNTLRARIVADYIAGMTDRFAVQEHRRLFSTETMI
ncbi:MAG: deoxyguanosinetriphosphate triphosphohydrolase [Alphaproteobacteria bacterium]|nr:deoxyguanosinetriphosphate triphosphohydrolase [Alphaproteobacteria bacterium]MBV8549120.1 deoxyguanosinetriphosphate triphosphohydrolase [Alphaproteobacteria bacterium]